MKDRGPISQNPAEPSGPYGCRDGAAPLGGIVEFLEGRDFMTAWVVTAAPHRLSVLARNGREMTVSQSRLLNSVQSLDPGTKSERLEILKATEAMRRSMSEAVDLTEMWEVLEGEGDQFGYEALAALFYGHKPQADEISAITRAVFADGVLFRFTPEGAGRSSSEEVERILAARSKAEEEERTMSALADWLRESVRGGVAPEPPDGARARELLENLALWGDKAADRKEAKALLERGGLTPDPDGAAEALVAVGEYTRHENLELRRMQVPLIFDQAAMAEVAGLTSGAAGKKTGRLDLTALNTITIDSNGARDLDDAISIKSLAGGRWQVGIHITDVASFITPGSVLDEAAKVRASSIYLPEGKYPMFPAELSEGLLSLTPGDVKPAFSFLATLEKDGAVSEYTMASSLIRVDRQLSFAEADQNMDEDSDLVDLWDLAQALITRREAQGGTNINIPKLNVYFQPDGSLGVGLTQWDTPAKTIVGELMILANYLAADQLHKNNYPCPYRYQDKARDKSPAETAAAEVPPEPDLDLTLNLAARRRTGRSGLSFSPAPHHGLGLPVYTAFTAPMRRYVDLLVARQLRALAEGGPPAMDEQELMRLALPSYELAQRIQKMQNIRQRYWLNRHLADKVGQKFSALIFEQRDHRLRVCVTDYMLEVDLWLPKGDGVRPPALFGQRLTVKLASVPSDDGLPRLEVVS